MTVSKLLEVDFHIWNSGYEAQGSLAPPASGTRFFLPLYSSVCGSTPSCFTAQDGYSSSSLPFLQSLFSQKGRKKKEERQNFFL